MDCMCAIVAQTGQEMADLEVNLERDVFEHATDAAAVRAAARAGRKAAKKYMEACARHLQARASCMAARVGRKLAAEAEMDAETCELDAVVKREAEVLAFHDKSRAVRATLQEAYEDKCKYEKLYAAEEDTRPSKAAAAAQDALAAACSAADVVAAALLRTQLTICLVTLRDLRGAYTQWVLEFADRERAALAALGGTPRRPFWRRLLCR
jgi:hypothetical protein